MKDRIARLLGISALVIAIVALATSIWRWREFEADTATIVIAVLASVVTIYMISHLINEYTLKQRIESSITSHFDKKIESVINHHMYLSFFFQGVNNEARSQIEAALYFYMKSLECLQKCDLDQDKYEEVTMRIESLLRRFPGTAIYNSERDEYESISRLLKHEYRIRVISALDKLSTRVG